MKKYICIIGAVLSLFTLVSCGSKSNQLDHAEIEQPKTQNDSLVASDNSNPTNSFVNSHGVVWNEVKDVQEELNLMPPPDDNFEYVDSIKYYTVIQVDDKEYTIVSAEFDADFMELSKEELIEDTRKYINRQANR